MEGKDKDCMEVKERMEVNHSQFLVDKSKWEYKL